MNVELNTLVVTLCGSSRFKEYFTQISEQLTLEGNVVLSLGLFSKSDNVQNIEKFRVILDHVHRQKIRMADYIYVIDPGGYVGESTKDEIEYAESLGKRVRYFSDDYPEVQIDIFQL